MAETVSSIETPDLYEYEGQQVDEALLRARKLILEYADNTPRLPIGEDERFDPTIHSHDTSRQSMSPRDREIGKLAYGLLTQRYAELPGRDDLVVHHDAITRTSAMLEQVRITWQTQFLMARADRVGHEDLIDWIEWALRYHDSYTIHENNESITPYYPVYRALRDLEIRVPRGKDRFQLPGVIIAPPGINVTVSEDSKCYVARWDMVGTDTPLEIPVDRYAKLELERRNVLQKRSTGLDTQAALIESALASQGDDA